MKYNLSFVSLVVFSMLFCPVDAEKAVTPEDSSDDVSAAVESGESEPAGNDDKGQIAPLDGTASPAQEARAAARAEMLERYDKDGDGKLGKFEIEKIARDRMLKHDLNKDGRIGPAEMRKLREKSRNMPPMDAVDRAMAVERAREAARLHELTIREQAETTGSSPQEPSTESK